jgi:hypothetical protein
MKVSGQLYAPAALPWAKNLLYSLCKRLGGSQGRSGNYGEEKKNHFQLPGIELRLLKRPVHSQGFFGFGFFFWEICEAIVTAATPGLLCQPRVIMKMIVEKQMECRLAGDTEVLGENLPQRHFCPSQNPT